MDSNININLKVSFEEKKNLYTQAALGEQWDKTVDGLFKNVNTVAPAISKIIQEKCNIQNPYKLVHLEHEILALLLGECQNTLDEIRGRKSA